MPDELTGLICEYCERKISPGSKYLKLDSGTYCVCKSCVDTFTVSDMLELFQVDFDVAS